MLQEAAVFRCTSCRTPLRWENLVSCQACGAYVCVGCLHRVPGVWVGVESRWLLVRVVVCALCLGQEVWEKVHREEV